MTSLAQLPRTEQLSVGRDILQRLEVRRQKGPSEPALDAFIPELDNATNNLGTHVDGKAAATSKHAATLGRVDRADINVDTWFRHHYDFIAIEAGRRDGVNVGDAGRLLKAAFPDGLQHIDEYIPVENDYCRAAVHMIQSADHASTVVAIGLPADWQTQWLAALDESDCAFEALQTARMASKAHVGASGAKEESLLEVIARLRHYLQGRAPKENEVKAMESKYLLDPLNIALAKARTEAATRATRKKTGDAPAIPAPGTTEKTNESDDSDPTAG